MKTIILLFLLLPVVAFGQTKVPITRGGTGAGTASAARTNLGVTGANLPDTLPVAKGGTGLKTLTINGILFGNTAANAGVTAAGTTGQVLTATTGQAPTWQAAAGGASKMQFSLAIMGNHFDAGGYFPLSGTITISPSGCNGTTVTTACVFTSMSIAGTLKNFHFEESDAAGAAGDTVVVYKNGAATTIKVAVATGQLSGTDLTHTVSVSVADKITYFLTGGSSGVSGAAVMSLEFDPS